MSKYLVTSQSVNQYPYSLQDLRIRPPKKKRTGLMIAFVACTSALCGGAAAYALLSSANNPEPVRVASLNSAGAELSGVLSDARAAEPVRLAARSDDEPVGAKSAEGTAVDSEPVSVEPVKVKTTVVIADNPETAEAAAGEPAPLTTDDPRWSATLEKPTDKFASVDNGKTMVDGIEIAETEEEVIALEEKMSSPVISSYVEPGVTEEPVKPVRISAPSFATSDLTSARATKWVNMRAAKNKHAAKMLVIPQDAAIKSDPTCKHWCRVVYDGKLGYVYRTYIRFAGQTTIAAKKAEPVEQKAEKKSGLLSKLAQGFRPDP